jgi:hypothetical protein
VTIRLTAVCDLQPTGEGQTIAPGVRRFQMEGARGAPAAIDVFPGGCVTYRPDDHAASAALLDQAQRAVTYRTRDDLRQALRRHSGGRLDLDPAAA